MVRLPPPYSPKLNLIERLWKILKKKVLYNKHYSEISSMMGDGLAGLVFYELALSMETAILWEKQIKSWSRKKKLQLIEEQNPRWLDLYESICA